ncbi:acyl carrier protein, partial [Amycolatopsis magusensis]
ADALAGALGLPAERTWPHAVELVPAGTAVTLAGRTFFGPRPEEPTVTGTPVDEKAGEGSHLLPWLSEVVREVLRLPADEPVANRSLAELGMQSMQAVALQYQLTDRLDADVPLEALLGGGDLAGIADSLAGKPPAAVVPPNAEVSR